MRRTGDDPISNLAAVARRLRERDVDVDIDDHDEHRVDDDDDDGGGEADESPVKQRGVIGLQMIGCT